MQFVKDSKHRFSPVGCPEGKQDQKVHHVRVDPWRPTRLAGCDIAEEEEGDEDGSGQRKGQDTGMSCGHQRRDCRQICSTEIIADCGVNLMRYPSYDKGTYC
jgi:hypothetical protein